jgi:hypothetical protein
MKPVLPPHVPGNTDAERMDNALRYGPVPERSLVEGRGQTEAIARQRQLQFSRTELSTILSLKCCPQKKRKPPAPAVGVI